MKLLHLVKNRSFSLWKYCLRESSWLMSYFCMDCGMGRLKEMNLAVMKNMDFGQRNSAVDPKK